MTIGIKFIDEGERSWEFLVQKPIKFCDAWLKLPHLEFLKKVSLLKTHVNLCLTNEPENRVVLGCRCFSVV